jgi:hypothetical protein
MKKELYERYKKLDENEKRELKHKLKKSPVAIRLTEFLENVQQANFKNTEVVEHIYKNVQANYATLENRYFKLRKKFLDEYLIRKETHQSFTEEEKDLAKCLSLLHNNEKDKAYIALQKLERHCWQNNIFELLPRILDQMVFCNQTYNKLNKNKELYKRLETAIYLNSEMAKFNMISRKLYEMYFKNGLPGTKQEFELLNNMANKHPDYPRFSLCYHYLSLYYKISSYDYFENMNVISRHYNKYCELHAKYPEMPMMLYRPNYVYYQNFHFKQISVFIHYNKCEFLEAYSLMKEIYTLINEDNSIFSIYKTDSTYINMLSVLLGCKYYEEAMLLIDNYYKFIKDNNLIEKSAYAHSLKLLVFVEAFTETDFKNSEYLLPKLNAYIKLLETEENTQFKLGNALALKARYYFCIKDYSKALNLLMHPKVKEWYSEQDMYNDYHLLFKICNDANIKENASVINELLLKYENILSSFTHPEKYKQAYWLSKACRHILQK